MSFTQPCYPAAPAGRSGERHPIVIVGGGMVGLTAALDLAKRGQRCVVLEDDDTVSVGSRAICHAKRSLEIFDRLDLGKQMAARGAVWNRGRVYFGEREIYHFDLLPEQGHQFPAFVNLQQYYLEAWLVDACVATGLVDVRWKHRVTEVQNQPDGVTLNIETPCAVYSLHADWLLAADGASSMIRRTLGLPFVGQVFRDQFLIADVRMQADFPPERRFWFEPAFHPHGAVLLHRQADDIWRIDFQLGWDADAAVEREPARVEARVRAMLGPDIEFELAWVSTYTFRCRRLEKFRHGRLFFIGDAAHQVSPFGARGGNGGVQDADNLCWKLDLVLRGAAPDALLDSYDAERIPASDENILNSTRSTDFITPKNPAARAYRDAVLQLARQFPFARAMVNSGRLSRPAVQDRSPLNTPDQTFWAGGVPPGAPALDAPIVDNALPGWLLSHLATGRFTLLRFEAPTASCLPDTIFITTTATFGALHDIAGVARERYAAEPGTTLLLRPDQHVAARWHQYDAASIAAALVRARGLPC